MKITGAAFVQKRFRLAHGTQDSRRAGLHLDGAFRLARIFQSPRFPAPPGFRRGRPEAEKREGLASLCGYRSARCSSVSGLSDGVAGWIGLRGATPAAPPITNSAVIRGLHIRPLRSQVPTLRTRRVLRAAQRFDLNSMILLCPHEETEPG